MLGVLAALGGGALWGFSGSCAQLVFTTYGLEPIWVISVRASVGAVLVMLLACVMRGRRVLDVVKRPKNIALVIAFGLFGLALTQFTYLMAINHSNAGTATMLEYIGPVFVVFVVCAIKRHAPQVRELVALACVVAGVFVLSTHGDPTQLVLTPDALGWGLASAVSMVFYTLLPAPLLKQHDNLSVLAWAMIVAGAVMVAWQRPWESVPVMDAFGWIALFGGLTCMGTVAAFSLYYYAVKAIGPSRTSMLASVEVVSATVFAALLGTPFEAMDVLGLVLIMATVFLLAKRSDPATPSDLASPTTQSDPR